MKKNINLIEKYIEFIFAQKNLAKNTVASYENDLSEFAKFIGNNDFLDFLSIKRRKATFSLHLYRLQLLFQGLLEL